MEGKTTFEMKPRANPARWTQQDALTDDRKLVGGASLNLVGGIANAAFGFAFTVLITRALSVADVGVFFVAISVFSILIVVTQLGTAGTIVKTVSEFRATGRISDIPRSIRAALVPAAVCSVLVAIGLYVLAPRLATGLVGYDHRQDETAYLRTLAPFVPIGALFAILLAATRGFGTMVPTVVVDSIAKPALRTLVALLASLVALSPLLLGALWAAPLAAGCAATGLPLLRLVRRMQPESPASTHPRAIQHSVVRDYWAFTVPQWLAEISQLAVLWIDVVLVSALASTSEAGVYAAVTRLATVGTLGLSAVLLVLGPELSALLALGDLSRLQALYRRSTLWLAAGSMPIFILLATFSRVIVGIFGFGYDTGAESLAILAMAMLVGVAAGPSSLTLLMGGKSALVLANSTVGFLANVSANVTLIPLFGMTGAAIAWGISILLTTILSSVQIRRLWGIRLFDATFAIITTAALVCFGVVGLVGTRVGGDNLATLLVSAAIGTLLYGRVVWWMRTRLELPALVAAVRPSTKLA